MATQAQPAHPATVGSGRIALANVMVSEWTKIRSVRSTFWSLLVTVVISLGVAALAATGRVATWDQMSAEAQASFELNRATGNSLAGLSVAQLAIAVLGVLVVSAEYRTGMIRTTLAAVPQRLGLLAAKAVVFAVVAFVVGTASAFGSFFLGQAIYSTQGAAASIVDPGVLRAVVGGGLYLAASGLFALGLAALLRHTAAAITVVVALFWLALPVVANLPGEWGATVATYYLVNAGSAIVVPQPGPDALAPWTGFGVFCAYIVAVLIAGAVRLRTRDA